MKLPPFEEFIEARNSGKLDAGFEYDKFVLPADPKPDKVVEFAERTAKRTAMTILRQYHAWLAASLATPEK